MFLFLPKALVAAGKEPFPTIYVDSQKEDQVIEGIFLFFFPASFISLVGSKYDKSKSVFTIDLG